MMSVAPVIAGFLAPPPYPPFARVRAELISKGFVTAELLSILGTTRKAMRVVLCQIRMLS